MNFEEYLTSKKIDPAALKKAEPVLWQEWQVHFEQMSPASFTSQKLYLINPLRRKYLLKTAPVSVVAPETPPEASHASSTPVAKSSKPVFKPKIK